MDQIPVNLLSRGSVHTQWQWLIFLVCFSWTPTTRSSYFSSTPTPSTPSPPTPPISYYKPDWLTVDIQIDRHHAPCTTMYYVPCTMYHVPLCTTTMYHHHVPCTMYHVPPPCTMHHVPPLCTTTIYHAPCTMYHVHHAHHRHRRHRPNIINMSVDIQSPNFRLRAYFVYVSVCKMYDKNNVL